MRRIIDLSTTIMIQTILLSYIISSICLLLKVPVSYYSVVGGLIISILLCKIFYKGKNWLLIILSALGVILICSSIIIISGFLYDYSCDGNWYHSHMIWELSHGWNPIYGGLIPEGERFNDVLWANYYQKGYELLCSNIVCITGNINTGKSINIILQFLPLYFVNECLNIVKGHSKFNIILSFVICFNPIVINQMLVYYNDWIGYTCIILTLSNIILWQRKDQIIYFINVLLILSFITTVKYNITFYSLVVMLILLLLFMPRVFKEWRRVVCGISVVVVSLLFFGGASLYNNTIKKGQPLYPLFGKETVDIMTINTPQIYLNRSSLFQINHSLLSNPEVEIDMSLLSPFFINRKSLKYSSSYDARIGGYGIFFFETTLLLIFLFIINIYKYRYERKIVINVLLSISACYVLLYIMPSGWWARYNPYVYIIPVLLILYLYLSEKLPLKIISIPVAILCANILISASGVICRSISRTAFVNYVFKECLKSPQKLEINTDNYCFVHMLRENNIDFVFTNIERCKWKLSLSPDVNFSEPLYITKEKRSIKKKNVL